MESKHFRILDFLNNRQKPVRFHEFPNEITTDFPVKGLGQGTLKHELEITLKNFDWIKREGFTDRLYLLTAIGKEALEKEKIILQDVEKSQPTNQTIFYINQAGAAAPNATVNNNSFDQKIYSLPDNMNFELLSDELALLKTSLVSKASTPEDYSTLSNLLIAENAAKNKDGNKIVDSLLKAGKWVLDAAKDIGTELVAEIIKKNMRI